MVAGVFVPVPTFFNDDESIDFETQVKHAKFLKDNGVSGITLLGSTGENVHLTAGERAEIVKTIYNEVEGFPIVAGVAQHCLSDAKDEIKRLADSGASYALVLPSSYFGAAITQDALVDWYTDVADFSPIPVLIYVYPGVTNGVNVAPSTIKTLAKHPYIKGIKFSHNDVTAYSEVALDPEIKDFDCLTGLGHLFLPALSVGFKGTVDAIAGAFPKIYVSLYKAFESGDVHTAKALQLSIIRVEKIVAEFGVIGIKRIIYEVGFGKNYLGRSPLNRDTSGGWERMGGFIEEVKGVEASLT